MPNLRFQTLLNKNPPIVVTVQEYDFSGVVLGGRIILSIFTQIRMILLMEMRYKRARVKTLDSLISSLQIPGDTGDHHPERFQQSLRTFLKMKMYQMFKLRTQPSPPFVNVSNKVERCSDKVGASGCCMQSRCHSPLHRKPICEPMS